MSKIKLKFNPNPPPTFCNVRRGPRAKTYCELLPRHDGYHLGRDTAGRWQSWRLPIINIPNDGIKSTDWNEIKKAIDRVGGEDTLHETVYALLGVVEQIVNKHLEDS